VVARKRPSAYGTLCRVHAAAVPHHLLAALMLVALMLAALLVAALLVAALLVAALVPPARAQKAGTIHIGRKLPQVQWAHVTRNPP
jgi:hypothetical protein